MAKPGLPVKVVEALTKEVPGSESVAVYVDSFRDITDDECLRDVKRYTRELHEHWLPDYLRLMLPCMDNGQLKDSIGHIRNTIRFIEGEE